MTTTNEPKRPVGRPVEKHMPEPIPDTPENIERFRNDARARNPYAEQGYLQLRG